jgi:hypothetical protein
MKRLIAGAAAAAVALALAACSGEQAPATPESEPATTRPAAAHGSLAECLKAQGIAESSGAAAVLGPPAGVDPAAWDAAMKQCSDFAPGPAGP